MSKKCCVCGEPKDTTENVLFTCQNHGCDVIVHQGCYGIVTLPSGLWFCRKCESQERAARVRCELCPKKEGALKRTDCGGWAHIVCALYIPEVIFGSNERMEPIVTSKLPRERFAKPCYICEERGLETQAVYGACMSCHKSSCRLSFHVTCAQKEQLLCEEEDQRDPRNLVYCGYCATHFKKIARQKYKQSLRKPLVTSPTSTVPPSPFSVSDQSSPPTQGTTLVTPHPFSLVPLTPSHAEPIGMEQREDNTYSLPLGKVKKEKPSSGDHPSKRPLVDLPLPAKKKRRRKVSSSNESTTSETLSVASGVCGLSSVTAPHSPIPSIENMATGQTRVDDCEGQEIQLFPATCTQTGMSESGGGAGMDDMGVARLPISSTSSEQSISARSQTAPPRSLQELLERQWEQTAQFILDQVGKQNNVGSMLAHLHTLQSENRQMQSRIMELASQREFYIAINTKLRQTLAEQDGSRPPNGVREDEHNPSPEASVESPQVSRPKSTSSKRLTNPKNRSKSEAVLSEQAGQTGPLSKETQNTFLKAHFTNPGSGLFLDQHQDLPHTTVPTTTHLAPDHGVSQAKNATTASKNVSRRVFQGRGTVVSSSATDVQLKGVESSHEVTRVTNSIQAPITTSFTPPPKESESILEKGGITNRYTNSPSMIDSPTIR